MTLYIGVDIHARQQTLSYLDTSDGTAGQVELQHERDDVKGFYCKFQGQVIVGFEACGYTNWFEELIEQLGHKLLVGDAAEIRRLARRRQKNDRRDADLLLDLHVLGSTTQCGCHDIHEQRNPFQSMSVHFPSFFSST
jgi:transposase